MKHEHARALLDLASFGAKQLEMRLSSNWTAQNDDEGGIGKSLKLLRESKTVVVRCRHARKRFHHIRCL